MQRALKPDVTFVLKFVFLIQYIHTCLPVVFRRLGVTASVRPLCASLRTTFPGSEGPFWLLFFLLCKDGSSREVLQQVKSKACHRDSALSYQQIIYACISLIHSFAIEDLEEERTDGIKLHAMAIVRIICKSLKNYSLEDGHWLRSNPLRTYKL